MTISTTIAVSGPYTPNGVTTAFPFGFKASSTADVSVVLVSADGTEEIVSTASYSVALAAGDDPGGTVNMAVAPANDGRTLWVYLNPTFLQEIKFEDEGAFNQTILNQLADEAGLRAVWLRDQLSRVPKFARGEAATNFPTLATGEGKVLSVAGGQLVWVNPTGSDSVVTINAPLKPGSYLFAGTNQAILDGVAAIINAAGGGVVQLPAGDLYINDYSVFNVGKLTIRGMGKMTTTLLPLSATGGAIKVCPVSNPVTSPTDMLTGVTIKDMTIYGGNGAPTSSIGIILERCQDIDIDIGLGGFWGGLDVVSCRGGEINTLARGNANFAAAKAGSFLRRFRQLSGGYLPAELHMRGNEIRGNNLNNYLEFCDLVQAADGLFFEASHGGFAKHTLALIPETTTTQLTGVKAEFWSDSSTVSGFVCRFDAGGTYTGQFGLHRIVVSNGYDTPKAIHINIKSGTAANNLPSQIHAGQLHHITSKAIHFEVARNWVLGPGADIEDTVIGIELGADTQDIILHPGRIRQGQGASAISQGINIINGATDFRILPGWEFEGCSFDIADNAASTDKTIGTITTDKGLQTISADGAGALYIPAGVGAVKVGTANNVGAITSSGGDGDTLMLMFTGVVSVFDTNNLKIANTFSATADDWMVLRQQGGNWYELSRSAN